MKSTGSPGLNTAGTSESPCPWLAHRNSRMEVPIWDAFQTPQPSSPRRRGCRHSWDYPESRKACVSEAIQRRKYLRSIGATESAVRMLGWLCCSSAEIELCVSPATARAHRDMHPAYR